jgi:hypothetical protein
MGIASFFDNRTDEFYIFGGRGRLGQLNDLWVFNLKFMSWKKLRQSGDVPSPRVFSGYT